MVMSFTHSFHTADILYIPFNSDNPKLSDKKLRFNSDNPKLSDKKLRPVVILNGDVPLSS